MKNLQTMASLKDKQKYYKALIERNSEYEGLFYVGVKTTGIFCRSTCSAKKPKIENCLFFETTEQAIAAGFRSCKVCKPLDSNENNNIQKLINQINSNPHKKWSDKDLKNLNSSTIRRQFKKQFGMTFIKYVRSKQIAYAEDRIKNGVKAIDIQINSGFNSPNGFRSAFSKLIGNKPTKVGNKLILKSKWINTPLGKMFAVSDEKNLYLLEFHDRKNLQLQIDKLNEQLNSIVLPGNTEVLDSIEKEIDLYFQGKLKVFTTPYILIGTNFRTKVWNQLSQISYSETISYNELALRVNLPSGFRAVANANASNRLAIIIPCHRVINKNGKLGGYAGGLSRKEWLINMESKHS